MYDSFSVVFGPSSLTITTNLGVTTFSNVSYGNSTPGGYSVSTDPVTGEQLITFLATSPPVLGGAGTAVQYSSGGPAVTIDSGLTISEATSSSLITGASVAITVGFLAGDQLAFNNGNGITGSYNAASGVLLLSGSASLAAYQAALDSLQYSSTSADPTNGGADLLRTNTWSASNAGGVSDPATTTIDVSLHAPPQISAAGTVTYARGQPPVIVDSSVAVSAPDSAGTLSGAAVQIGPGFLVGDTLTFSSVAGITGSFNSANGVLSFSGVGAVADYQTELRSVAYSFSGDASAGGVDLSRTIDWSVNDGVANSATATSLIQTPPCYCAGAHILTQRGEVAVEDLCVGDLAVTAAGRRRPIVWIGHRRLDVSRHPMPTSVWPVRVSAGAFGDSLPKRDLWQSPGHNVACEGALMPMSSLINSRSVKQIEVNQVEYWHVELDAHDVILAEGLPAESYLDTGNRTGFANGGVFVEAHPDFAPRHWADTCLPLVLEGPAVAATRTRLLSRLAERGCGVTQEADAHVQIDGLRIEPILLSQTRLAFVLPSGGREITLRSRTFVPAHTVTESGDPRALGLCVAALQIDGSAVGLGRAEHCRSGWHEAEYEAETFTHRWTAGSTACPPARAW